MSAIVFLYIYAWKLSYLSLISIYSSLSTWPPAAKSFESHIDIGAPAEAANERIARLQAELGHLGGVDERPQAGWFDTIAYCGNVNIYQFVLKYITVLDPDVVQTNWLVLCEGPGYTEARSAGAFVPGFQPGATVSTSAIKKLDSVESSAPATPAGHSTNHYTPPSSVLRGLSQLAIASPQVPAVEVIEESQVEEVKAPVYHGPVPLMHQKTLNFDDTLMDTQESGGDVQPPGTGEVENQMETTKASEPVPPAAPAPVAPSGSPPAIAKADPPASVETKQTPKTIPSGGSAKDSKKDMYHDGSYWKKLICTYVLTSIHCTSNM